jgi:DNA-binding GntR family transcriptional regulator
MSQPSELEPLERHESLAERAYQALREKIATADLAPGQRLTERGLAVLLGVSPTPVREAIRRLEQEGLLTRPTPRSLTVVEHSEQALRELLHAEIVLRAAIARFATDKITDAAIDQMATLVDVMLARAGEASAMEMLTDAAKFDAILQTAADSAAVTSLAASAGIFSRTRRLASITAMRDRYPATGLQHLRAHGDIVDALRARDADRVEQAVRAQLIAAYDLLLSDLDPGDA